MTSIAQIERAAGITWSPDERTTLAGWVVSSSGGFTRRTNCAAPTATSATDIEARAAVESWLTNRGASLVVRVTPLAATHVIARTEETWRLDRADETVVMTKPLGAALSGGITLVDPADPSFATELLAMNGRPADAIDAWTRMVRRLGDDAIGVWEQGRAVGLATVAGALAAIYSVAVDDDHRRKGLATETMGTAEAWAKNRGAATAFLQVREDNHAAQAMYAGLGYEERYRYHYLQPRVEIAPSPVAN